MRPFNGIEIVGTGVFSYPLNQPICQFRKWSGTLVRDVSPKNKKPNLHPPPTLPKPSTTHVRQKQKGNQPKENKP